MPHYPACFTINRLELDVALGVPDVERATPQTIAISMRLYFPQLPDCGTNDHGAFVDYATLCTKVCNAALGQEFRLIEFMAQHCFTTARAYIDAQGAGDARLWLKLTKLKPAVKYLQEGAAFTVSDVPAGATFVAE